MDLPSTSKLDTKDFRLGHTESFFEHFSFEEILVFQCIPYGKFDIIASTKEASSVFEFPIGNSLKNTGC